VTRTNLYPVNPVSYMERLLATDLFIYLSHVYAPDYNETQNKATVTNV
jgi:hypothetical protein